MDPVPGFELPETFGNQVSFRRFLLKMVPLLVIAAVFLAVVFAFVLPGALTWVASALLGVGCCVPIVLALKPGAPALLRRQVAQNTVTDAAGRPVQAILLAQYDQNWSLGRIGGWIRAYRPDLLS